MKTFNLYIIFFLLLSSLVANSINPTNYELNKNEIISKDIPPIFNDKNDNSDTEYRNCNDSWIGDGWCDSINNNEECQYDGGDCCPGDCESTTYDCGSYGGTCEDCIDPNSSDISAGGECSDDMNCSLTDCGFWLESLYSCEEIESYGYDCSYCYDEDMCNIYVSDDNCYTTGCGLLLESGYECHVIEDSGYDCSICGDEGECVNDEGLCWVVNELTGDYGWDDCDNNEWDIDIPGCMDSEACNFNEDAQVDDGSCFYYQDPYTDCEGNPVDPIDYATQIQPIFNNNCTQCHHANDPPAGLTLLTYQDLISSYVIVPGSHTDSFLWDAVNTGYMPPGNNQIYQMMILI